MSRPACIAWYRKAECMASLTVLLPRKENDRFDTPPEVRAPGRLFFIQRTASMKSTAYLECSSIPVPMDRILTSKMMSSGLTPALSVSRRYALSQMDILRSNVVAWPSSSNAMTTIAAPYDFMTLALRTNSSSPSLRLMELTMHLPWAFRRPAIIVSQCEESIIRAALAVDGSLDIYLTNFSISLVLSSMASSMLMSMTEAPSSICLAAMDRASSYFPSEIRRANLRDPATFVLSPTLVKLFSLRSMVTASSPLTFKGLWSFCPGIWRGVIPATALAMALIWPGVVPQHPPTMFTIPF